MPNFFRNAVDQIAKSELPLIFSADSLPNREAQFHSFVMKYTKSCMQNYTILEHVCALLVSIPIEDIEKSHLVGHTDFQPVIFLTHLALEVGEKTYDRLPEHAQEAYRQTRDWVPCWPK